MSREISIGDDIIDSRDAIKKLEELNDERESLDQAILDAYQEWFADREDTELTEALKQSVIDYQDWSDWEEYKQWKEFSEEGESIAADWIHGEAFILDRYFKEYAEQLADDIGSIDRNARWPNDCIDWDRAARELQMDYSSIEIDGHTYWARS
jgi:hypothetical protein